MQDTDLNPGLYSVVAFDIDRLPSPADSELSWMVFLALNVERECFIQNKSCQIDPVIHSRFAPCKKRFDHETTVNLFLIKQNRKLSANDFIASGDILRRYGISPLPAIVEYERFRDPRLYEGTPLYGMQYKVMRCSRMATLMHIRQRVDERLGYGAMEAYLHTKSRPYKVYPAIQRIFPQIKVTERMIKYGRDECSYRQEFHLSHFDKHLEPILHEKDCPELEVEALLDWFKSDAGKNGFRRLLLDRINYWLRMLVQESRNFRWIHYLSIEYDRYSDTDLADSIDKQTASDIPQYRIFKKLKTAADSVPAQDVLEESSTEQDEEVEVEGENSSPGISPYMHAVHPSYARAFTRVLYRGTRIMSRLQLLIELYVETFDEFPEFE
ncbi:unnamed protein product [Echinostoma caproni]|uniref:Transcription initiation factor TFIID subunit 5 n=1 Tax=Echinostoma caproni TaxID=27848 RepID=A0A183A0J4_9TREM|nr:unnamed protein product [Echinostoma caproni]